MMVVVRRVISRWKPARWFIRLTASRRRCRTNLFRLRLAVKHNTVQNQRSSESCPVSACKNTHLPDGLRRFRYLNRRSLNGKNHCQTDGPKPQQTISNTALYFTRLDQDSTHER